MHHFRTSAVGPAPPASRRARRVGSASRARAAFPLIDLLAALAALVVLAGVAIPVLAEAQRSPRLTMDLADLMEHARMKDHFVAANRGRMPSGPPGQGRVSIEQEGAPDAEVHTGPPSRPSAVWGGRDLIPHNALNFPLGDQASWEDTWRLYHLAFGDFAVDGQGVELLDEVFLSSGRHAVFPVREDWEAFRNADGVSFPDDFDRRIASQASALPSDLNGPPEQVRYARLAGSYRYTLTAQTGIGFRGVTAGDDFWETRVEPRPFSAPEFFEPIIDDLWNSYRAYVQESDFLFPSRKVMFWQMFADHNRDTTWYTTNLGTESAPIGAHIPTVNIDGSVVVRHPAEDMPVPFGDHPLADDFLNSIVEEPTQRWAVFEGWTWTRPSGSSLPTSTLPPGPMWCMATRGGSDGFDYREAAPRHAPPHASIASFVIDPA